MPKQIHDTLVKGCVWDNEMKSINWRIDVCTKSRHLEQLNQPSAVVEMKLEVIVVCMCIE